MYRVLLFSFLCMVTAAAEDTLHFVIPDFKPFTYVEDGEIKGIGVERVGQSLDLLKRPYTLRLVPNYGRAVEETRRGVSDGFFLATKNSERDGIAKITKPLIVNRWCWFSLKENRLSPQSSIFKSNAKVTTPLNTNTHKWLKKNGFNVTYPASDLSTIIPLLLEKKVDAVFIAEEVFHQLVREHKADSLQFERVVEAEKPFALYISLERIEKEPTLVDSLNVIIDSLFGDEVKR